MRASSSCMLAARAAAAWKHSRRTNLHLNLFDIYHLKVSIPRLAVHDQMQPGRTQQLYATPILRIDIHMQHLNHFTARLKRG